MRPESLFSELFNVPSSLTDRRAKFPDETPVDVIIPVMNSNPLWERNLHNFFERIPINRLLIGDAGCSDETIEIVKRFPRVQILDHSKFKTLGFSLAHLMDEVQTDWFIYLHADVFLPDGWYESMQSKQSQYDWFECSQRNSVLVDYVTYDHSVHRYARAYSGAQMGRKDAFQKVTPQIEDDFLYRNEDIIFAGLIEKAGYRYGRNAETYLHHQVMNKRGEKEPKFASVAITRAPDRTWEVKTAELQIRGLIKYLQPTEEIVTSVWASLGELKRLEAFNQAEFLGWIERVNPAWLPQIKRMLQIMWMKQMMTSARKLLGRNVWKVANWCIRKA